METAAGLQSLMEDCVTETDTRIANGILNHKQEIHAFLDMQNIVVLSNLKRI